MLLTSDSAVTIQGTVFGEVTVVRVDLLEKGKNHVFHFFLNHFT